MKTLILENENNIPDQLADYVNRYNIEFNLLNNLYNREENEIHYQIEQHNNILIQSTLSDEEQFQKLAYILSCHKGCAIYLLATGDYLHNKIHNLTNTDYKKELVRRLFKHHEVWEIVFTVKQRPRTHEKYWKHLVHYFDVRKLYHSEKPFGFFPERPVCWSDDELKDIYKYEPKWIRK